MSDSAGSGESGGMAGAGQDAEADNEPPQQAPPLPEGGGLEVGETSEDGAPQSAKRARMSEEEPELEEAAAKPIEMHGETPAQGCLLQEDAAPSAKSRVPAAASIKLNIRRRGGSVHSCSDLVWLSEIMTWR